VAVLFQNDSFGKDLMKGFEEAIADSKIKIVARESYEVTDPTVSPQVVKLAKSGADTFLNIATPKPAAQAIGTVAKSGWKPLHILNNVAASKSLVLQPVGFEAAQGIYTLSYFKDPEASQFASDRDVQDYKTNLKKYGPKLDPNNTFNVYGWLAAATMVETLKQAGKDLDREKLMDTIRNLDVEIPMLYGKVKTGAGDGFPIQTVQIQQFKDENWEPVGEMISNEQ
jgi:branched-chain amino acid transport system substrate-binding protein